MLELFIAMIVWSAGLAFNLVKVQGWQGAHLAAIGRRQRMGVIPLPAMRGSILDRAGRILAASVPLQSLAADPREMTHRETAALLLSDALHVPLRRMRACLVSPGTFVWLARKISDRLVHRVERLRIPGVFALAEDGGWRVHPAGSLASHVLGWTDIDDRGREGLELSFESVLRGRPGEIEAEMETDGDLLVHGWRRTRPAIPGRDVVLTLDENIQFLAERALQDAVERNHARGGECIVMDVPTGDILAMATRPAGGRTAPAAARRNRAITDPYEPGSTFKVFLGSAALDSGRATLRDRFFCGDSMRVDSWTIHNAEDGESTPTGYGGLRTIIVRSLNVGTANVSFRVGARTWRAYLKRFGFLQPTGLPLPGEAAGIVPPGSRWPRITLATTSFGQGIAVTPIQLCSAMQAIANGGVRMKPRLVRAILDHDGRVQRVLPPRVLGRVVSERTAARMRGILRAVVTRGTGRAADAPGYPCAGKTGTAQVAAGGGYPPGRYIASFLGFAPVSHPRIVVLVKVDEPRDNYYGGAVAAPAFRRIVLQTLWRLGVPPAPHGINTMRGLVSPPAVTPRTRPKTHVTKRPSSPR